VIACAFALAATGRAETTYPVATEPGSGVNLHLATPLTAVPVFGYLPLRLRVENSSALAGVWQLNFQAGQRTGFPGRIDTTLSVNVAAGQNQDTWIYVPLAEPGVVFSSPGAPANSSTTVPTIPPATAGIYPGPEGVKTSFRISKTSSSGSTVERTFVITQTGPAALLPTIPENALPARTSIALTPPFPSGEVKRTTTMTVVVLQRSASTAGMPTSPTDPIVDGARQKLLLAGLMGVRGTSASSSTKTAPLPDIPGMSVVTVTFRQTGPTENLPRPPANQLPKGFDVEIAPGPIAGTTMRSFIYKENISTAELAKAAATAGRGGTSMIIVPSPTAMEAAARQKLASTKLLTLPAGLTQTVEFVPISFPTLMSAPLSVVLFVQTGPVAALPKPPASEIPEDIVVNLHPGPAPGRVVRTISYVDAATLASATATSSLSPTIATVMPLNLARVELARYGFLRSQPGVQLAGVHRTPTGIASTFLGTGTAGPSAAGLTAATTPSAAAGISAMIVTETGPANLLPVPPPTSLPPGVTANLTTGALPGETVRNFVMPVAGGGGGAVTSAGMTPRAGSEVTVDITGPGLKNPLHLSLTAPLYNGSASTPPLAVSTPLEAPLRGKLSGLRGTPSMAPLDPGELPDDWRVWSPFHGVVLRTADFAALDAPRRAALRSWVALGGQVFLVPENSESDPVPTEFIGAGSIKTLLATLDDLLPSDLGSQLNLETPALSLPAANALGKFEEKSSFGTFVSHPGSSNTWLLVFMVGFAAMVGPLNLFLFASGKKRYRLFFTTPLIALCGAITLGAAIIFQDGFGGEGVRTAVVSLLPEDNAAAIFQDQAARTGLLGATKFPLEADTVFTGVPLPDYNITGRPSLLTREAKDADGDWFRNRWREAHHLRRLSANRGRVDWVGVTAAGAPIIASTLNTALHDFVYIDDSGDSWSAKEVPPGKRVTLTPTGRDVWTAWMGEHFTGSKHLESVLVAVAPRESRRWMATGGDTELAPIPTLASIRWTNSTVIYTGVATTAGRTSTPRTAP
jgi:hypothetical protein